MKMSWDEIIQKYPNQWVKLVDVDYTTDHMSVATGVVRRAGNPTTEDLMEALYGRSIERHTGISKKGTSNL